MISPTTHAPHRPHPGQLSLVELHRVLRAFSEATNPVDGQDWRIMTWVEGQIAAVEAAMEANEASRQVEAGRARAALHDDKPAVASTEGGGNEE